MKFWGLSLLSLVVLASNLSAAPGKMNVLYIVADDLRCDLGCEHGPAKTPAIDSLARRGVRFSSAYCQQAVCNPSRSSFLTGRRPDDLHIWSNGTHFRELNPDVATLPGWLKSHGYVTRDCGKIFHNWHIEPPGDRQSWSADEFLYYANHGDDIPLLPGKSIPENHALSFGRKYAKSQLCECRDVPDEAYYDGRVAAEAVKVLGEIKDQPFFLAVGFWKPHAPFNPPKKYWDLYDPEKLPIVDRRRPQGAPNLAFHDSREILGMPGQQISIDDRQAREIMHGYLAGVSFVDAQVAKLLNALEKLGLAENTLIVFHSDHGYHLGEHSLWAKTSNFELDAHVPLLIIPPRCEQAGKVADNPVELVDMFPTVCDLCDIEPPAGLAGKSLGPCLQDVRASVKPFAYTQHPRPAYYDRTEKGVPDAMGYSVRIPQGRYTEWRDWETGKVLATEFYNHVVDLPEMRNLAADGTATAHMELARGALELVFPKDIPPAKR